MGLSTNYVRIFNIANRNGPAAELIDEDPVITIV